MSCHCISCNFYEYTDSNGLFNYNQFGFRRGRTIDDQFLLTCGMVSKYYDVGYIVDLFYFYFAIASDVVSHHLLLDKLRLLGI